MQIYLNAAAIHVLIMVRVKIRSMDTHVYAPLVLQEFCANRILVMFDEFHFNFLQIQACLYAHFTSKDFLLLIIVRYFSCLPT